QRLVEGYTKPSEALGAQTVGFFPELAWKFPKLSRGAVVVSLQAGPIQELGVAERSVVISIDGRDTPDGASFAQIVDEEHDALTDRGGSFRLLVQADSGDPREFSQVFPGKVDPGDKKHGRGKGRGTGGGSGGINIWDRTTGGKGGGRDDPTQ